MGAIFNSNKLVSDLDIETSRKVYPSAGHVIADNLKIISYSRIRSIIAKGRKYRFPVQLQHILMNFVNVDISESILSVILKRIGN